MRRDLSNVAAQVRIGALKEAKSELIVRNLPARPSHESDFRVEVGLDFEEIPAKADETVIPLGLGAFEPVAGLLGQVSASWPTWHWLKAVDRRTKNSRPLHRNGCSPQAGATGG